MLSKTTDIFMRFFQEIKENASRKGKFNVSPYNLPVVQPHSDASTNMYSSTSIEEEINSTEHLDYPG